MTSDHMHSEQQQGVRSDVRPAAGAPLTTPVGAASNGGATTFARWQDTTLEQLRAAQQQFADERNWHQYHTPRNLLLALTGEVGELAEIFQWRGDAACGCGLPGFSEADRQHVAEELSDVLLYLVRLADACGIDLGAAALDKIRKNARKYPVHLAHGSAAKYTELARQVQQARQAQQAHQAQGGIEQPQQAPGGCEQAIQQATGSGCGAASETTYE